MKTTQHGFRLTALSTALMAVFGTALADDAQINQMIKPDSSVSVGLGNWSGPRDQQGIYDGMRKGRAYGLFDADVVMRDDVTGTWWTLKANNLGLENRDLKVEYLRQGDIGASFEYSRTLREDPLTFTTRLQGVGTTANVINIVPANPGPLQTVKMSTERDLVGLGFYKSLTPDLNLNVSFKNEDKKGTRNWSRGSAVEFLAEPIDSVTRQLEVTLNYNTKAFQLSGGYYGSWYDNSHSMVTAITSGAAVTVANTTYLSLPLDNQAHKLFLNGGYNFTPSTRGTFKVEYTHATQSQHLPMKDVPTLSFVGSPETLSGAVNTTLVQLGLTSRPISELSLVANLRYHNMDDATPVNRFVQGGAGTCITPPGANQCTDNTPLSYKTLTAKLEGTYRLPDGYSVTAGVEDVKQDRTVPVSNGLGAGGLDNQRVVPWRARLDETTLRLELRRSLSDTVNGSLSYLTGDRKGSTYVLAATGPGGVEPDFANPINIADRQRDKVRMAIDWSPIEALSIQANVAHAKDIYPDNGRGFGLKSGIAHLYGIDASYKLNDNWRANAWYSYDHNKASQLNSRAAAGPSIKNSNLEDAGKSLGIGIRGDIASDIAFGADLQRIRNNSRYNQALTAAQTANMSANMPDIENALTKLSLFANYVMDKNTELRFDFIHERWKTNDWTWQFAGGGPFVFGTATDGTTVTSNQNQSSNFLGARYIYKFQ